MHAQGYSFVAIYLAFFHLLCQALLVNHHHVMNVKCSANKKGKNMFSHQAPVLKGYRVGQSKVYTIFPARVFQSLLWHCLGNSHHRGLICVRSMHQAQWLPVLQLQGHPAEPHTSNRSSSPPSFARREPGVSSVARVALASCLGPS